jgi:dTDP-4-dehydrorhamnose reductase
MAAAGLPAEIDPIASEDWPSPAIRPKYAVLDCGAIRAAYGIEQPDWRDDLAAVIRDLEAQDA